MLQHWAGHRWKGSVSLAVKLFSIVEHGYVIFPSPIFMMKSQRFMTRQFCFSGRQSSWKEAHHLEISSYRASNQRNIHWLQSVIAEGGKVHREETVDSHPQGDASRAVETDCETPEQKKSSEEPFCVTGPMMSTADLGTGSPASLCGLLFWCRRNGERPGLDLSQSRLTPRHHVDCSWRTHHCCRGGCSNRTTIGMLPLLTIIQRTEVEGEGGNSWGWINWSDSTSICFMFGGLVKSFSFILFSSFLLSSFLSLSLSFFSALKLLCNTLSSAEIPSSTLK